MKYKINKNLILQKMDKNLVGFDTEGSFLYTFNETAQYIFKKIKLGWEEDKIVDMMEQSYQIDAITLKKDVKSLIKDMLKNKILSPSKS